MRKAGIHARLLVAGFFLICAATFSLDYMAVQITRQFMDKRFKDRITFLAKYLAMNSEVGVLIGDKAGLRILALNLLGEEDVARVTVINEDGKILVEQSRPVSGKQFSVETPVVFKKNINENLLFRSRQTLFGEQKTTGMEYIGKVRIHYTTYGIDQLMVEITRQFFIVSGVLVVLAAIIFFFISRSIVKEVTWLAETAARVGQGAKDLRAPVGNLPETRNLAVAFNRMLDSLEKSRKDYERVNQALLKQSALAERGKFSLMVAHEVKNPLSIIKGSFQMLKKDFSLPHDNLMIQYIDDEVERLNRLIEDFLLFARPCEPMLRQVDLNLMMKDIVARFEVQLISSPVEIKSCIKDEPWYSMADMDLLIRGVSNIVKNACEANQRGGVVGVHVVCDADQWAVEICDQGDGVESENLERIFDPFFTTRASGTGLGLAFARQVIGDHAGTIGVKNAKEGGAVFTITLPRMEENEAVKV
ncbi:AtoS2 [Desulforapulum autotrophicum HRM2]|uniref:histidine kinase n=1 Tax=Desulforapulum autotrophicum (strain ATCC 43914 / DSM 3382 / VKM B-1955 / HRM2) TaxID=177437 RepID=C0QK66_DESAH|nr:sensor histidine kinase [Desulforapulum autotrophicum]ACN16092.1 AtoS2 [Desulforapulum autotrophicum HRM2]